MRDRVWDRQFSLNERARGFFKFDSITFPLMGSDQGTTHWATKPWGSEGGTVEAVLILVRLNEGIMSLNLTGICVYHAAFLTLWSQGLMCINPPRIAWIILLTLHAVFLLFLCDISLSIISSFVSSYFMYLSICHHLSLWCDSLWFEPLTWQKLQTSRANTSLLLSLL